MLKTTDIYLSVEKAITVFYYLLYTKKGFWRNYFVKSTMICMKNRMIGKDRNRGLRSRWSDKKCGALRLLCPYFIVAGTEGKCYN